MVCICIERGQKRSFEAQSIPMGIDVRNLRAIQIIFADIFFSFFRLFLSWPLQVLSWPVPNKNLEYCVSRLAMSALWDMGLVQTRVELVELKKKKCLPFVKHSQAQNLTYFDFFFVLNYTYQYNVVSVILLAILLFIRLIVLPCCVAAVLPLSRKYSNCCFFHSPKHLPLLVYTSYVPLFLLLYFAPCRCDMVMFILGCSQSPNVMQFN